MSYKTPLLVLILATALFARGRISFIEFFGYKGLDADAVRKALPFREGDMLPKNLKEEAQAVVKRVTGSDATDVARVCCQGDGDSTVFIGLAGASSRTFSLNPAPEGGAIPASELTTLYGKMQQAETAAFNRGSYEEDGAPGYRLSKDPGARAAELAIREYALHHEDEIIRLLESSGNADQRAMAADALGYGELTTRQAAALIHASRDPSSEVRNNATRALGEILRGDPSAAAQISPDTFIDMIRSGTWTDRNKGSMVLGPLTQTRDPQLLARVKAEAGDALLEMARWRVSGWTYDARFILGRIAGIPEGRLQFLVIGPLDAFLAALAK